MCGGIGSRLKPLTESTPKPLLKIMNVPVLEQIICKLIYAGINDIYLSLGFKAQDIIDFCERKQFAANIYYFEEEIPLGTAGGVKNCIHESTEPVIVLSGDNLFDIDIDKVWDYHITANAEVTVVGKKTEDPREYGVIIKDETGRILSFLEKPTWEKAESFIINTGIYIINGSVLRLIQEHIYCDFAEHVFPALLKSDTRFMCYQTEGFWGDIGEFGVYRTLSAELLSCCTQRFLYSGTLIAVDTEDTAGNVFKAPCLIGANGSVGTGNRFGPNAVIGDGFMIGNNCSVADCIIGDHVSINDGSDVSGAILDDGVSLGANCAVEEDAVLGYGVIAGKFTRILSGCKIWPGRNISSESLISRDVFYETPLGLDTDIYGISGKLFSQLTLSDCVKLAQATASVKNILRIGVGCDAQQPSGIYKNVFENGVRTCGVICYDFDRVFKAQAYFYSAYSGLDLFVFISYKNGIISFSFVGKNGLPVSPGTARAINNNFRFSAFRYAAEEEVKERFNMNLLSFAYHSAINKMITAPLSSLKIQFECEDAVINETLKSILLHFDILQATGGIQFIINPSGTDMYAIEDDLVYTSDQVKSLLCELQLADGKALVVGEDMSEDIENKAAAYGCQCRRIYENEDNTEVSADLFLDNLWNFDALFLCFRLLNVIVNSNMTLKQLLNIQRNKVIKKRVMELNCSPAEIRGKIDAVGAKKKNKGNPYYYYNTEKGTVKIRQLGNASRVRVMVEAADAETAKELSGDIYARLTEQNNSY